MGALPTIAFLMLIWFALKPQEASGCGGCGPSPRAGKWGKWSDWSSCSGNPTRQRQRKCDNPRPAYGGAYCSGDDSDTEDCNACQNNNGGCHHSAYCRNSYGSRRCYCPSGYQLGSNKRACYKRRCKIGDLLLPPEHGRLSSGCNGRYTVDAGTVCTITCDGGYKLNVHGITLCRSDGTWAYNAIQPKCARRSCRPWNTPLRGSIEPPLCTGGTPLHGQACTFGCKDGYTIVGPIKSTCNDGVWTSGSFDCKGYELARYMN